MATFGWPAWKVSAPAGDKAAGLAVEALAAADKAAADKAVAGKAAAEEALAALAAAKAAADKEAAERAAADKAAADKARADKAAADKAAAGNAAAYKAVADAFAADKEANKAAAEPQEHVFLHTISAAVEKQLARGYYPSEIRLMCPGELVRVDWSSAPRGLHIVFYEGEENGFNVRDAELSGQGFALYSVSRIDGCRGDTRVYALWMKRGELRPLPPYRAKAGARNAFRVQLDVALLGILLRGLTQSSVLSLKVRRQMLNTYSSPP